MHPLAAWVQAANLASLIQGGCWTLIPEGPSCLDALGLWALLQTSDAFAGKCSQAEHMNYLARGIYLSDETASVEFGPFNKSRVARPALRACRAGGDRRSAWRNK